MIRPFSRSHRHFKTQILIENISCARTGYRKKICITVLLRYQVADMILYHDTFTLCVSSIFFMKHMSIILKSHLSLPLDKRTSIIKQLFHSFKLNLKHLCLTNVSHWNRELFTSCLHTMDMATKTFNSLNYGHFCISSIYCKYCKVSILAVCITIQYRLENYHDISMQLPSSKNQMKK